MLQLVPVLIETITHSRYLVDSAAAFVREQEKSRKVPLCSWSSRMLHGNLLALVALGSLAHSLDGQYSSFAAYCKVWIPVSADTSRKGTLTVWFSTTGVASILAATFTIYPTMCSKLTLLPTLCPSASGAAHC
jgi:hypothetical protein